MKSKELLELINILTKWCRFFKKNVNFTRWSDIKNEIQIELTSGVDYTVENKERLVVHTNVRDDFDKFIDCIKKYVDDYYYEILANKYDNKITLHIELPKDFYSVIKSILQLRISDIPMKIYIDKEKTLCIESDFNNGYIVLFELRFDDIFEVSLKRKDTDEYLNYSFAYIYSNEMFDIMYKVEQAEKGSLENIDERDLLKRTGLTLKYKED